MDELLALCRRQIGDLGPPLPMLGSVELVFNGNDERLLRKVIAAYVAGCHEIWISWPGKISQIQADATISNGEVKVFRPKFSSTESAFVLRVSSFIIRPEMLMAVIKSFASQIPTAILRKGVTASLDDSLSLCHPFNGLVAQFAAIYKGVRIKPDSPIIFTSVHSTTRSSSCTILLPKEIYLGHMMNLKEFTVDKVKDGLIRAAGRELEMCLEMNEISAPAIKELNARIHQLESRCCELDAENRVAVDCLLKVEAGSLHQLVDAIKGRKEEMEEEEEEKSSTRDPVLIDEHVAFLRKLFHEKEINFPLVKAENETNVYILQGERLPLLIQNGRLLVEHESDGSIEDLIQVLTK